METHPTSAMILAAGLGRRMLPLTNNTPKPLLKVGGTPMVERAIQHLIDAKISKIVINTYYLADQFVHYFEGRALPNVKIIREPELLDSGGGVANALPFLQGPAFLVLNSDIVILSGSKPLAQRLFDAWKPNLMDALLLLQPITRTVGYKGPGDFHMTPNGSLLRPSKKYSGSFVFTGIQILKRELFQQAPTGPFSLNLIYDAAQERGKLFGLVHDGEWIHVGTPNAIKRAEAHMKRIK